VVVDVEAADAEGAADAEDNQLIRRENK